MGNSALVNCAWDCKQTKQTFDYHNAVIENARLAGLEVPKSLLDESGTRRVKALDAFLRQYCACKARMTAESRAEFSIPV